jgi:CBS domain-containing protein
MMASNPLWCKSVTEWKEQYGTWIQGERILMCSIFFDYDFVYGDKALVTQLRRLLKNR